MESAVQRYCKARQIGCTAVLQSPTNRLYSGIAKSDKFRKFDIPHATKPAVGIATSDPMFEALDVHLASQDTCAPSLTTLDPATFRLMLATEIVRGFL